MKVLRISTFVFLAIMALISGCSRSTVCPGSPNVCGKYSGPPYSASDYAPMSYKSNDPNLAILQSYGSQIYPVKSDQWIITIPSDNLFETGTATLQRDAGPILAALAKYLQQFPNEDLFITAYTDPDAYNGKNLSEYQALQIAGYLWANDIPNREAGQRLFYEGKGKKEPIATNERLEGLTFNRRIQITIMPKGQMIHTPWIQITQKSSICKKAKKVKRHGIHHPYQKTYASK